MNFNLWQGNKIRLRGVEPEDWQNFFAWNDDSEVARLCYEVPFPGSKAFVQKWTEEQALAAPKNHECRWVIETLAGEMVGTFNTHSCDARCGTFKYGLAIGRVHWRKGYAAESIRLVLRYFFQELRYQKCTVHIYEFNPASILLHRRLGFVEEGRLRRMIFTQGKFWDEVVLGITNEEFADEIGRLGD